PSSPSLMKLVTFCRDGGNRALRREGTTQIAPLSHFRIETPAIKGVCKHGIGIIPAKSAILRTTWARILGFVYPAISCAIAVARRVCILCRIFQTPGCVLLRHLATRPSL